MNRKKSTEEQLAESIERVRDAVFDSELLHLTHGFMSDPGRYGLVTCFVVLPDAEVEELRGRLDVEIARFMEEKGHQILTDPPVQ